MNGAGGAHDALLVDLDGTVYRGGEAVEGAVASLEAARTRGVRLAYVTNNAARGPQAVAEHLLELGLTVTADDVVTSAQAAASVLSDRCAPGARVLVLGTEALAAEVRAVGLEPVRRADDGPAAVVQGHSPETGWADLAEATVALAAGAVWVVCNVDTTLPSERGLLPGNGALVAAMRAATGLEPEVAGKPASPLLAQSVERVGSRHPLVVGDRIDTDVAGANAVGADSLLVLTGVSTPTQLLTAPPSRRPTHLAADLRALDAVAEHRMGATAGWRARLAEDEHRHGPVLVLGGEGDRAGALRALCAPAWACVDDAGDAPPAAIVVRADGDEADEVITTLGLPRT